MANILEYPILRDLILPFILIFTLVFAILEKSQILGQGKQQINAIIAFAVAGILMAFSTQVDWIKRLTIVMIFVLFLMFVLLLVWGFVWGETSGDMLAKAEGLKWTLGITAIVIIAGAALYITGYWDKLKSSPGFTSNLLFIIFIIAAIVTVMNQKKDKKG